MRKRMQTKLLDLDGANGSAGAAADGVPPRNDSATDRLAEALDNTCLPACLDKLCFSVVRAATGTKIVVAKGASHVSGSVSASVGSVYGDIKDSIHEQAEIARKANREEALARRQQQQHQHQLPQEYFYDDDEEEAPHRKGHTVFGCCCDTRMACIIVDAFPLICTLFSLMTLMVSPWRVTRGPVDDRTFYSMLSVVIIGICSNAVGLYGSLKYHELCTAIASGGFALEAILIWFLLWDWKGVMLSIFFLYPHVVLYYELKKGIITRSTYHEEKECICGTKC